MDSDNHESSTITDTLTALAKQPTIGSLNDDAMDGIEREEARNSKKYLI